MANDDRGDDDDDVDDDDDDDDGDDDNHDEDILYDVCIAPGDAFTRDLRQTSAGVEADPASHWAAGARAGRVPPVSGGAGIQAQQQEAARGAGDM